MRTNTRSPASTPGADHEEMQAKAAAAVGLSVRVFRIQERLRKLPLDPTKDWQRRKRTQLIEELIEKARADRCLPRINPWAAASSCGIPQRTTG